MIPVPNTRLLELVEGIPTEHYIFPSCGGGGTDFPAADSRADERKRHGHSPATGALVTRVIPEGPVCETQSRPGLLRLAAERDGPGTDETPRPRVRGSVLAGVNTSGNDEPDVAARLAEPPSLLHPLRWLCWLAGGGR